MDKENLFYLEIDSTKTFNCIFFVTRCHPGRNITIPTGNSRFCFLAYNIMKGISIPHTPPPDAGLQDGGPFYCRKINMQNSNIDDA